MLLGRQVAVPDLHGAINYWCEAVQIAATLRKAAPDRIMDLRYEDLVADVPGVMADVLRFATFPPRSGSTTGPTPIPSGTSGATRWTVRARGRSRAMRPACPDPWLRPEGLRRFVRARPLTFQ
jgi:hypothetical protein